MAKRQKAQQDNADSRDSDQQQELSAPKNSNVTLADIMNMDVLTGTAEQNIGDAARLMAQQRVSCIVVGQGGTDALRHFLGTRRGILGQGNRT